MFVVEGEERRVVKSGILAAGMELTFGPPRDATDAELGPLADGIPVELLEPPDGPPFVVVGGTRHSVRGIPVPHPVSNRQASEFPQGAEINVAAGNVSRRMYRQAASPQHQLERVKRSIDKRGVVGTAKAGVRKVSRKLGSK
jgi:hypothetical protein